MPITNPANRCYKCGDFYLSEELRGLPQGGKKICFQCCYLFYKEWAPLIIEETKQHEKKNKLR